MKDPHLKLTIALARTHTFLFQQIELSLKAHGLNLSEFGVLEFLYHKGDQPVQKIAEKILVSSGTITYNIDKLVQRGFVKKINCPNDRRIFYVSLTTEGHGLIHRLFPEHEKLLKELFEPLSQEEQRHLIQLLGKLT